MSDLTVMGIASFHMIHGFLRDMVDSWLEKKTQKMSWEYLIVTERKETIKDYEDHV